MVLGRSVFTPFSWLKDDISVINSHSIKRILYPQVPKLLHSFSNDESPTQHKGRLCSRAFHPLTRISRDPLCRADSKRDEQSTESSPGHPAKSSPRRGVRPSAPLCSSASWSCHQPQRREGGGHIVLVADCDLGALEDVSAYCHGTALARGTPSLNPGDGRFWSR